MSKSGGPDQQSIGTLMLVSHSFLIRTPFLSRCTCTSSQSRFHPYRNVVPQLFASNSNSGGERLWLQHFGMEVESTTRSKSLTE